MNNKIAVILPIYKKDKVNYLTLAINSILNQTYHNFKLYLGIDGPLEEELNTFLEQYEKHDQIAIIRFQENRGLPCVLNDLIRLAIQEGFNYFARMDADDISNPTRFEKQIYFLQENPDVDVVGGAIEEINSKGETRNKIIKYPTNSDKCRAYFSTRNPLAHPAVLFKKSYFDKAGFYNESYRQNQDTILWYEGFKKGCIFANLTDVVLRFRMTEDLFRKRRNGLQYAIRTYNDRKRINKELGYGFKANLFALMMFIITIAPTWFRKLAYRIRK